MCVFKQIYTLFIVSKVIYYLGRSIFYRKLDYISEMQILVTWEFNNVIKTLKFCTSKLFYSQLEWFMSFEGNVFVEFIFQAKMDAKCNFGWCVSTVGVLVSLGIEFQGHLSTIT